MEADESKPADICRRTFEFALRIIRLSQYLDGTPGAGRVLSRQLLRSWTSIGANVEEAQAGQSRADFRAKLAIALKEARETRYWLRLIEASKLVHANRLRGLETEASEIANILGAILAKSKTE